MTSINEIILKSTNPFDNYRSVNFWHQQQDSEPTVESIHQEAIAIAQAILSQVAQDHRTRTVRIEGDPGSGKTYLLGRLKRTLNSKAFFAYIPPFPQNDYLWRHILRYTVDSMVQIPTGQQNSQLLLWLTHLSIFKKRPLKNRSLNESVLNWLRGDRQKFIKELRDIYQQSGINNADNFFGVLYDLTNPALYPLACEWLRGDDLSEESLAALAVKQSIDTEEAAYETLANFGRISTETQPIVLCFDQLESIARLPDGSLNLQALLNANTKLHDENRNFLIIISIITNTWKQSEGSIDQSHKDRLDQHIYLKAVNLEQAELLWATRLHPLHRQANPQPESLIYPLNRQYLEAQFPGGKTTPRNTLILGRDIFQEYKNWLAGGVYGSFKPSSSIEPKKTDKSELLASFKLKWLEEFEEIQQSITQIRHFSSPELIQMLLAAIAALQMEEIRTPLLTGTKFANYSLGYQFPNQSRQVGIVWTEDQNMSTFFYVMDACRKAIEQNPCQNLQLIRAEKVGKPNLLGHKLYAQIFTGSTHRHITPHLISVHYLTTYYSLVKDAREGDLVVGSETLGFKDLQALIQESKILHDCPLLQDLKVVSKQEQDTSEKANSNGRQNVNVEGEDAHQEIKEFLLTLVQSQQYMGRKILIQNTRSKFSQVNESQVQQLVEQLCRTKQLQIMNPDEQPEEQLVRLGSHFQ